MAGAFLAKSLGGDRFVVTSFPVAGADKATTLDRLSKRSGNTDLSRRLALTMRSLSAVSAHRSDLVPLVSDGQLNILIISLPLAISGPPSKELPFTTTSFASVRRAMTIGFRTSRLPLSLPVRTICRPTDDVRSPLSTFSHGLHLHKQAYARTLLAYAKQAGANVGKVPFQTIEMGRNDRIVAITLEDGSSIEADLFIDASGPAALLPASWDARLNSLSDWLPFDTSVQLATASHAAPAPFSRIEALPFGWRRTVPAMGRTGEALIYSSKLLSAAEAENVLVSSINGEPSDLTHSQFTPGHIVSPWTANCIAIGATAAILDPLYPGALMLIQRGLERLLRLFPGSGAWETLAREYNRETTNELERYRDFVALRISLNERHGEQLWDLMRSKQTPPELSRKKELYASRGIVPMVDGDLFDEADWALIFDEHCIVPRRHDILADVIGVEQATALLDRMKKKIAAAVSDQPLHGEYLMDVWERAAA